LKSRTAATPKIRKSNALISRPLKKIINAIIIEIRLSPKKIIAFVFMGVKLCLSKTTYEIK